MQEPISVQRVRRQIGGVSRENMVWIPGGNFLMGSDSHYAEEAPVHHVRIDGFWMDKYAVTNSQFQRFVEVTGYVTVAERPLSPEDYPDALPEELVPGSLVFQKPADHVDRFDYSSWWAYIPGADWCHPEGPDSSIAGRGEHPVVHVAYEDALAYASWVGKGLPTEAQWERAARGGIEGATYTWGNELEPEGQIMANTWRGEFPWQNLRTDGKIGPMPVGSFPPNVYGLFDMAGNVWEWTTDGYQRRHSKNASQSCCIPVNPKGEEQEQAFDPSQSLMRFAQKVLKGGSFLCAPNYCLRYRPAARIPGAIDTSTCHIGFRCIVNAIEK